MSEYVAKAGSQQKNVLDNISGAQAAEIICSSETEDPKIVGFDAVEAARLGLKQYQYVSVTPSDNGAYGSIV